MKLFQNTKSLFYAIRILKLLKIMLEGKKTYVTAVVAIITVIGGYLTKTISLPEALAGIFAALQTMNLRSAITTESTKK